MSAIAVNAMAHQKAVSPRIARLPGDLLRYEMMHHPGDAPDTVLAEILDEVFLPWSRQRPISMMPTYMAA